MVCSCVIPCKSALLQIIFCSCAIVTTLNQDFGLPTSECWLACSDLGKFLRQNIFNRELEMERFTPPSDHNCLLPILEKVWLWMKSLISHSGCLHLTVYSFLFWEKVIWMISWPLFIQNRFQFDMGPWTRCASLCSVLWNCFKTGRWLFLIFCIHSSY